MNSELPTNNNAKIRIGFDAKRYFNNRTGLGNYARWVINNLVNASGLDILLFNPRPVKKSNSKLTIISPTGFQKTINSIWRIKGITKDLEKQQIQIYHGLSNELPFGIHKTSIKTVVTIHDLINKRYPAHYSAIDLKIYNAKLQYAQKHAHQIVVPSIQTKDDLIHYFGTDSKKIKVIPLSIENAPKNSTENKQGKYILCVSSFTQRKNLVRLVEAFLAIKNNSTKLIIAGSDGETYQKVKELAKENSSILLQTNVSNEQLHSLYQNSLFCVYPSVFEGFGIPILEAFSYGKAVATSQISSMPEVGGNAAIYFDPTQVSEIKESLLFLLDESNRKAIESKVLEQFNKFSTDQLIPKYIELYQKLS